MLFNDTSISQNKVKNCRFYFNKIDFFSEYISFNYDESRRIYSSFGIFLTILLVLITSILSFVIGQDLYLKNKPSITQSEQFNSVSEINIDNKRAIMFAFRNNDGNLVSQNSLSSLTVTGTLKTIEDSNIIKTEEYDIDLVPCSNESYNNNIKSFILSKIIEQSTYCTSLKSGNYTISNPYRYYSSKVFIINIEVCDNLSPEECQKIRNGLNYIDIYYLDNFIDPYDYENPIKYFLNNKIIDVSIKYATDIYLDLKKAIFDSNNGWIFDTANKSNFIEVDVSNKIIATTNYYININLSVSLTSVTYYRSYLKLQDILASVGGFTNGFIIICKILFFDYFEFFYLMKVNKLITREFNKINKLKKENNNGIQNIINNNNIESYSKQEIYKIVKNPDIKVIEKDKIENSTNDNANVNKTNKISATISSNINNFSINNMCNSSQFPLKIKEKRENQGLVNNYMKDNNNKENRRDMDINNESNKDNMVISKYKENTSKDYINVLSYDSLNTGLENSLEFGFFFYLKFRLETIFCFCFSCFNKYDKDKINAIKNFVYDFLSIEKEIIGKLKQHIY